MELLLLTLGLLALAVGGIAIKLWAKKDGEFAGLVLAKIQCSTKTVKLVVSAEKHQINTRTVVNLNTHKHKCRFTRCCYLFLLQLSVFK